MFALDQNGQQGQVTNGAVVTWMVAMCPTDAPENKWYKIPANLLPPNLAVAYVNFMAFLESHRAEFGPAPSRASRSADTRPLITPQFREAHPDEWQRLWDQRPAECPVCHETPDIWDGPMNSDVPTRCTHWACDGCWERIAHRDRRCPICGTSLRGWLSMPHG